jgi:uncharacterized metal-binding protein
MILLLFVPSILARLIFVIHMMVQELKKYISDVIDTAFIKSRMTNKEEHDMTVIVGSNISRL